MKQFKLFLILLLINLSITSNAQIDYKALIKNLEEITIDTNLEDYFKGLSTDFTNYDKEFKDERFLRYHGVIVDDVEFDDGWEGQVIKMNLFNDETDYKFLKEKLTTLYSKSKTENDNNNDAIDSAGDQNEINNNTNDDNNTDDVIDGKKTFNWTSDTKEITMEVEFKEGKFYEFKYFSIKLLKK